MGIPCLLIFGGCQKGGFPKGWFWRMFPRNQNRNEGTFGCSPGTKTATRVRSHVDPERKPERGYIRQNNPFTKPPFCLPVRFSLLFFVAIPLTRFACFCLLFQGFGGLGKRNPYFFRGFSLFGWRVRDSLIDWGIDFQMFGPLGSLTNCQSFRRHGPIPL